ncbi:MAG: paraquat-inducible PqiA family protein [Rhizobium sp.]|nr:paraquat-inducible PqiA family protein [Rhizobium sp.]
MTLTKVLLPLLFVGAPVLFAFGITLPLVTFEKLYFFEDNPSLIGIVWSLCDNEDYALAGLVALFSILFPFTKMVAIAAEALAAPGSEKGWFAKLVPFLSKWSMMDVMLVAIVIAAAKTSGLANAFTEAGLWCYAGSALMTSAIQWIVAARVKSA